MHTVQSGLEHFIETIGQWIGTERLGLLCNPASVDKTFRHARELIHSVLPGQLKALYSPQHGFLAEKQDNMIESDHTEDPILSIPVFSLYGQTRVPTREMFDPIDLLIVDLQDAGTRVYTFIYTLSYCMEAARRFGKKILVLDRPNPVNGCAVEGNCLNPDFSSFVGRYPIPMRHGLTIGELARLFNDEYGIGCELEIVPMRGWQRSHYFSDTGLPWVAPSPNLPTPNSAMVYPGQVIWEGTNVSEGRGTTQPFELFGAPFFNCEHIFRAASRAGLPGARLRPTAFEPTFNKWQGHLCRGFQLHVTDPDRFEPYQISLALLQAVCRHHPDEFQWKSPPYEYEFKRLPIDLIIGDREIRQLVEQQIPLEDIRQSWSKQLSEFSEMSRSYHLYK